MRRALAPLAAALLALPLLAAADPGADALARGLAALERDRRGPEGIAALAELDELADELPDLAPLARAYQAAADDRRAHPEVRALARFRLFELFRSQGELPRAEAALARLGFVRSWQVIGPFDDEGKRGFDTAYPPEAGIDLGARFAGKGGEVGWRALPPELAAHGLVQVGTALRPAREVVAYALAVVEVPHDQRAVLWLGASGAAKVWVNGALALSDASYHPAQLDQRGARVWLRRGPNRILVKLARQEGRMGFTLRLDRGDGEELAFRDGRVDAVAARPGPAAVEVEDAVATLTRRAEAARSPAAEARARRALSAALRTRGAGDVDDRRALREAIRAADAAAAAGPPEVAAEALLWAASLDDDHGARRQRIEAALALAPADARALLALARDELAQERPQAAVRLLERAAAAAPGWAAPQVALVDALAQTGLDARSARLAAELARRFPAVPGARRAAARAAMQLGRLDEAIAQHRAALALRADDAGERAMLVQLLAERRDLAAAEAVAREGLRLFPGGADARLELAALLAANGKPDEAEALFAEALRLAPEDAQALARRGRARLAAGRARDALADLERSLALQPQQPALRELVRGLAPAQARFEEPYLVDGRALARDAGALGPEGDEDAVVLASVKVTRVLPSGLSATAVQQVVKVLTPRGVERYRRQSVGFTPGRQELEVVRARVISPDGGIVEAHDVRDQSTSDPAYRLYYDTARRVLTFPTLAPGDVLEVAWRVEDTAGENLLSDYFGDLTYVDTTLRQRRFDYVLLAPASRPIHASRPEGIAHAERTLPDGLVEHRWTAADVPAILPEPAMPGWSEVARVIHVSTYERWDEVNRFYWGLLRDQLRPGPELRAVARRLAAEVLARAAAPGGKPAAAPGDPGWTAPVDPALRRALVEAAYAFVVSQTRYVGLEFGIHGYKPYAVEQVLARRFGDCKDKASLLHALLAELGIDSRLVLVRTRDLGGLPAAPASLAAFNHVILYVPELDLWLDGTAAYSGPGDLPGADRGATVLVLDPSGPPRFGSLPEAAPGDDRVERRLEVTLSPDGSAAVTGEERATGVEAPAFRAGYEQDEGRRRRLEAALSPALGGVQVQTVSVSDVARLTDPFRLAFTAQAPRFAAREGAALRFDALPQSRGYAEALATLSSRRHPLQLASPRDDHYSARVVLPPGWRVAELPSAAEVAGPFGAYELRYAVEDGAVVAEAHVRLTRTRIAVADYPAFRALLTGLDQALQRKVRILPPAPAEASR